MEELNVIFTRIAMIVVLFGTVGIGLVLLTAAKEASDKAADPTVKGGVSGKRLICLGYADTDERIVPILPENFPMPARVTKVLVTEGEAVTAGQKLLDFDGRLLAAKVKEAENAVDIAKKERAKAESAVKAHGSNAMATDAEIAAKNEELNSKKAELKEKKFFQELCVQVKELIFLM